MMEPNKQVFSDEKHKMNKKETITIIRSLLSSRTSGCGIYTLNKEFKDETGINIPLFGYDSLSEFLESLPDTIILTGLYPAQKVSLVKNDTSGHIVSLVKRQRRDKKSKKGVGVSGGGLSLRNSRSRYRKYNKINDKKSDVKQNNPPNLVQTSILLSENCRVISSQKLDNTSNDQETKEDLESGCSQEVTSPKNYFKRKRKNKKNSKVSDQNLSSNQIVLPSSGQEVTPIANVDPNPLQGKFFEHFIQSDEKIPSINLEDYAKVGHYIEVYPCEIYHLGLFYFHFRQFRIKLTRFMDELNEFYNSKEIPGLMETPKLNQVCAVCYSRNGEVAQWHRIQVAEILSSSLVDVRLVDYGIRAKIFVKNLKLLHRDFISFPKQAVQGSLANIKPCRGRLKWSKSAIKSFHELAFCRDLVGGVVSVNCNAYSVSMALSSTVGEEVHVNDKLVEEGHAEFEVDSIKNAGEEENSKKQEVSEVLSPVFFSENGCSNSRLQKMFIADE